MSENLKSWGSKLTPFQHDLANKAVEFCLENNEKITLKRDAVETIMVYYLEQTRADEEERIEVITHEQKELPQICGLGFLQYMMLPKAIRKKWVCTRPIWKRGKPIIAGDGEDIESIKQYCSSCQKGYALDEQQKLTHDTILAIKKFGDSEINIQVHGCIHPENDFLQVLLGDKGQLACTLRNKRVDIEKVCIETECEYLSTLEGKIQMKTTQPYQKLAEELEHKP